MICENFDPIFLEKNTNQFENKKYFELFKNSLKTIENELLEKTLLSTHEKKKNIIRNILSKTQNCNSSETNYNVQNNILCLCCQNENSEINLVFENSSVKFSLTLPLCLACEIKIYEYYNFCVLKFKIKTLMKDHINAIKAKNPHQRPIVIIRNVFGNSLLQQQFIDTIKKLMNLLMLNI